MEPTLQTLLTAALGMQSRPLDLRYAYAHQLQFGLNGELWKGRKPASGNITDILTQLVMDDQTGPCVDRIVSAQLDRDPEWSAMRDGVDLETDDPVLVGMSDWHQEARLLDALKDAARSREWAGEMVGRVYIPDKYEAVVAAPRNWTLPEALALVRVQALDPRRGGPIRDGHGDTVGYYCRYSVTDPQTKLSEERVEVHTPEAVRTYSYSSGTYLLLKEAVNPFYVEGQPAHLTDMLMWHAERDGGSAITQSVMDAQDRLNVASTYMARNDDLTGFRQIIVSNAEQPLDDQGKPAPWSVGPQASVRLVGLPYDDVETDGNTMPRRHMPEWKVVDPLDPTAYSIPSVNHWTRKVRGGFDQEWTLEADLAVSGESKRQGRKAHDKRVAFASADTGAFLAWALRAALVLASTLLGEKALNDARRTLFVPKLYLDMEGANLALYRELLAGYRDGALDLVSLLENTPGIANAAQAEERVRKEQAAKARASPTPAPTEVKDAAPPPAD